MELVSTFVQIFFEISLALSDEKSPGWMDWTSSRACWFADEGVEEELFPIIVIVFSGDVVSGN